MSNNNEKERMIDFLGGKNAWIPPLRKKGTVEVPSIYADVDWSKVTISEPYTTDVKSELSEMVPSEGLALVVQDYS